MTNARENERVTINKEFDSFAQFMEEYVTNISRTGAFVKTSTPLPVGTEVDLRFTVVMDGIETIEGVGVVVRVETDPALVERLMLAGYKARAEQAIVFTVKAWDANCPQHIPQKLDLADVASVVAERDKRIAELEAELARLKKAAG